jgi:hypothetical protein
MKIRMTYSHPEQTRVVRDERGREYVERIPNHPTREARPWEVNGWWEDVDPCTVTPTLTELNERIAEHP